MGFGVRGSGTGDQESLIVPRDSGSLNATGAGFELTDADCAVTFVDGRAQARSVATVVVINATTVIAAIVREKGNAWYLLDLASIISNSIP